MANINYRSGMNFHRDVAIFASEHKLLTICTLGLAPLIAVSAGRIWSYITTPRGQTETVSTLATTLIRESSEKGKEKADDDKMPVSSTPAAPHFLGEASKTLKSYKGFIALEQVNEALAFIRDPKNQLAMPNECRLLAAQLSNLRIRHKFENEKIQAEIKQLERDFPHLFQSVETETPLSQGKVLQSEDTPFSKLAELVDDIKVLMLMEFSVTELKEFVTKKQELRDKNGDVIMSQREVERLAPRVLQMKYNLFNEQGSLADLGITNLQDAAEALMSLPSINEKALKQFLGIAPDSDVKATPLYKTLNDISTAKINLSNAQRHLDLHKTSLTNIKAATAALTNTNDAKKNWVLIADLEKQIAQEEKNIAQFRSDLDKSRNSLIRVLQRPFGFDRMRHAFGGRVAFEALPILDLKTCELFNRSDYIDFVQPKDMSAPIMRGVDYFNRNFIAIKFVSPRQKIEQVMTIHERYTNEDIWYANGSSSFIELDDFIYGRGSFQTRENDYDGKTTDPEVFFKRLIKEVISPTPTV